MPGLRIPTGVKIIGSNLVPSWQNMQDGGSVPGSGADGQFGWTKQIQNWDWTGSIKPQIDYLVGNGVGCNTIRFSTQVQGVSGGLFTAQKFDDCVMQVANYCAQLGVYLYYSPSRYDNASLLSRTIPQLVDEFLPTILKLQQLPNVIGVDLLQEANFAVDGGAITVQKLLDWFYAMKAAGVTLPMTYSQGGTGVTAAAGAPFINSVAAHMDVLDVHCYTSVQDNQFEYLLKNFPGKEIVIGEFGFPQSQSVDVRRDNMRNVLSLGNSGNPLIRGSILWGCYAQDTTATNDWGAYDGSFNPRLERLEILRRFTGGAVSTSLKTNKGAGL